MGTYVSDFTRLFRVLVVFFFSFYCQVIVQVRLYHNLFIHTCYKHLDCFQFGTGTSFIIRVKVFVNTISLGFISSRRIFGLDD